MTSTSGIHVHTSKNKQHSQLLLLNSSALIIKYLYLQGTSQINNGKNNVRNEGYYLHINCFSFM